jgi:endonuclease YncB( thermonuclease family)
VPLPILPPAPSGEGLKPGLARPRPLPGRGVPRRPLYTALGTLAVLGAGYAALRSGEPAREAATAQSSASGKAADARTAEAGRTEAKPAEAKSAEAKPSETKPAPRNGEARPAEAKSAEAKSSEAKPGAKREPVETGALVPDAAGPVAGVAEVLDTATLRLGGRTLRLYGVESARGAQASDLSGYLGGRPVNCQPTAARTAWICTVDGHDLSEVVLYNGGGRATAEATPDLIEAERHARTGKLGIWAKP